jgi:DNA invertase Pin-like site-specific DNA recombinase
MDARSVTYEMYARKSQEADDRQALSISAQTRECLLKFPEVAGSRVTEESFSAKAPGRPLFDEMIRRIERGEIQGIVAWHPDRLSRNSVDAGRIIYLLDIGKLKDLKFCSYTFENTPEGKWMLSMVMSQAKYQVDKLSIEVRRGNREKYERGGISWTAPQGYRNNKLTLEIEPDPDRFDLVRRMWDMLLSGAYTVPQIQRVANGEWRYRTLRKEKSGDRPIALATLYRLFRNPLYCCLNVRPDGTVYECGHRQMVTPEEFWEVQKLLGKRGRPKPKSGLVGAYTDRLMRCGECGCSFTIERKGKRLKSGSITHYTHYRCTKKRGLCSQRYMPEKTLEDQFFAKIGPISMGESTWQWVRAYLKEIAAAETTQSRAITGAQVRTAESVEKELSALKIMFRKGFVDEHEFIDQRAELLTELPTRHQRIETAAPPWLGPALSALDFGYRCAFWFMHGDAFDKKTIVTTTGGSDLSILNRMVNFQPVGPFLIMAKHAEYATWSAFGEDIRTFFLDEEHQGFIPELKPLPTEADRTAV